MQQGANASCAIKMWTLFKVCHYITSVTTCLSKHGKSDPVYSIYYRSPWQGLQYVGQRTSVVGMPSVFTSWTAYCYMTLLQTRQQEVAIFVPAARGNRDTVGLWGGQWRTFPARPLVQQEVESISCWYTLNGAYIRRAVGDWFALLRS